MNVCAHASVKLILFQLFAVNQLQAFAVFQGRDGVMSSGDSAHRGASVCVSSIEIERSSLERR